VATPTGQIVAVLLCLLGGLMTARGESPYEVMEWIVLFPALLLLISALFLVWSRETRPYIPFLGVMIMVLGAVGNASVEMQELARAKQERLEAERGRVELDPDALQAKSFLQTVGDTSRH
jgi:CHASE2 domain-containing sensor protein